MREGRYICVIIYEDTEGWHYAFSVRKDRVTNNMLIVILTIISILPCGIID